MSERMNGRELQGGARPRGNAVRWAAWAQGMGSRAGARWVAPALLGLMALMPTLAQGQFGPPNDFFTNRIALVGDTGVTVGDNYGATPEPGEPQHWFGSLTNSVWFTWTPTRFGYATFDTYGSMFDTVLAVYQGASVQTLFPVARNDDYNPPGSEPTNHTSQVTFFAFPGNAYQIAIVGYRTFLEDEGFYTLSWSLSDTITNVPPSTNQIEFASTNFTVNENLPGVATITVTYNGTTWPVTVDYGTANGTALAGTDYFSVSGTLQFQGGEFLKTFIVPIIDNGTAHSNKTVNLSLANPTGGANLGVVSNAMLTIVDDETVRVLSQAGEFNFSAEVFRVAENETFFSPYKTPIPVVQQERNVRGALITVTRTGGSTGRVLVDYYTTNKFTSNTNVYYPAFDYFFFPLYNGLLDDIAVEFEDYYPTNGTLIFDDFQMSTNFMVMVDWGFFYPTNENYNKFVNLVLANPRPAPEEDPDIIAPTLGGTNQAVLGIVEVNGFTGGAGAFSIERATYRMNEYNFFTIDNTNKNVVRVDVILPGGGGGDTWVDVRTFAGGNFAYPLQAGSDYSLGANFIFPDTIHTDGSRDLVQSTRDYVPQTVRLFFPDAQTTLQSFYVTNVNDSFVEFNEDIEVALIRSNNREIGPNFFANVSILYEEQPPGALDREWNPDNVSYSPETPFNLTPGANNKVYALAIQPDQKTIIGGEFTSYNSRRRDRIARLFQNGFLDETFNPGTGADGFVAAIALYPTNATNTVIANRDKIVIGGGFLSYNGTTRYGIARLNSNGSLDTTFNPGNGVNGPVWSLAIQTDGKIVVGGSFTLFNGQNRSGIVRLNEDGSVDPSFNPGGGSDGPVFSVAVRDTAQTVFAPRVAEGTELEDINDIETGSTEGQLIVDYDFLSIPDLIRVYYDGVRLLDFFNNGVGRLVIPYGPGNSTQIRIVMNEGLGIPGTIWYYTAYINPKLTRRTIYVGGDFVFFDGRYRSSIARLNDDGSLDTGFDPGSGANGVVYAVAVQPDSRVLMGGTFSDVDFRTLNCIARLNHDGRVDDTFYPGTGFDDSVYNIVLQPDNKPLIGGIFTSFNQTRRTGLTRLFASGALDTTFMDTAYNQFAGPIKKFSFDPPNYIKAMALETNGNLMIGGSFTNLGGNAAFEHNYHLSYAPVWTRQDKRTRFNVARLINTWGTSTNVATITGTNATFVEVPNPTQGPGNMEFIGPDYTTDENAGVLSVTLRRIDGRLGTAQASIAPSNRVAQVGVDFILTNAQPTWPEFAYAAPVSIGYAGFVYLPVTNIDDLFIEGDETFDMKFFTPLGSITLGGEVIPLGASLARDLSKVTMADNDFQPGTLAFSSPTYTVNENGIQAVINVIRTNGNSGLVSVDYYTQDGSANAPADYRSASGKLRFDSGVTNAIIRIPIVNDTTVEFDESVLVVLTNVSGGATLPGAVEQVGVTNNVATNTAVATLWIIDNDFPPGRINFATTTYATNEGAGSARITVTRTGGNVGEVAVTCRATNFLVSPLGPGYGVAVPGVDFLITETNLVWVDGDTAPKEFIVPLLRELPGRVEPTNVASLLLTNASVEGLLGNRDTATLLIRDDDAFGALRFSSVEFTTDENGTNAIVTVIRINGVAESVSAQFDTGNATAVAGVDYLPTSRLLVFTNNEIAKTVEVRLINNTVQDGDRTVNLTLTGTNLTAPSVARLTIIDDESAAIPAGSLDTSFNENDAIGANDPIYALALQPDGKLLIAGDFTRVNNIVRNSIARIIEDATLDGGFNAGVGPNGPIRAMSLQPDGRIVIGGYFTEVSHTNRSHIARLNNDGSLDAFFNPGAGTDNPIFATLIQPDGRILIGGSFATYNAVSRPHFARLNTNGSLHVDFNLGAGPNGTVYALALQVDGKILVGGDFTQVNNTNRSHIARLNADGSLDTSFDPGTGADGTVRAIVVQADGRVVIGGSFANVNGVARNFLCRLNWDGSVDPTFMEGDLGGNDAVFTLVSQADGKLIVGGNFTRFNGVSRNRITRLLGENGRTDPAINFGEGANGFVAALAIQADRKIVLAGGFTAVQGRPRNRVARVHGGSLAGPGSLEFSSPFFTVDESGEAVTIVVRRRGGTTGVVSAECRSRDGTAANGLDYIGLTNTLVFPQGETFQSFQVNILDDLLIEGPETVLLSLTNLTGGVAYGPQPNATITILSDDCTIGFANASFSDNENIQSGFSTITLIRTGPTNGAVSVDFSTLPTLAGVTNLATPVLDYTEVSERIYFAPGETNKTAFVPLVDDALVEGNEVVPLQLSTPLGPAILGLDRGTLLIVDDDFSPGELRFAATAYVVNEYEPRITLTILRTNGSSGLVSVNYTTTNGTAVQGQDYVRAAGTLGFGDGETVTTIDVPIVPDFLAETNETFSVVLSTPTGGATLAPLASVAVVTILNNNLVNGNLNLAATNYTVNESNRSITLTVTRAFGSNGPVTVSYRTFDQTATNGVDYTGATNLLQWAAGDPTPKTFTVPITDDGLVKDLRAFGVELFNPTGGATLGARTRATVTIFDDDTGPGLLTFTAADYRVSETGTNAVITVLRRLGMAGSVSIDFAASGGSARPFLDYVPTNGTLIFLDGETNKVFAVPVFDNAVVTGDRTVNLRLANPQGGATTNSQTVAATLTLLDDETAAGSLDAGVTGTGANGAVQVVVVQTNSGKLFAGGQFTAFDGLPRNRLVRLNANGTLDTGFDPGSLLSDSVVAVAPRADDMVYVGGYFTNVGGTGRSYLARLNRSGTLDATFLAGLTGPDNYVAATALQSDGKLVIGGQFTRVNGTNKFYLARLEPSGALDPSFSPEAMANGLVRALVLQPDGKILLAGDFTWVNGVYFNRIARLNADGTLDPTFNPGLGADDAVMSIALQSDHKIVLGGLFLTVGGALTPGVARLNADGSLDVNFLTGQGPNDFVNAVAVQPDGKILVGGAFTVFDGVTRNRLTRLHRDGSVDYSINFGSGANSFVASIVVQADRKIVIGGGFTEYDGVNRNYLARLNGGDNVGSGLLVFSPASYSVPENGTNVTLTVRRQIGTSNTVQVSFATLDGTASGFAHYLPTNGFLTFPPGEAIATVTVPILDDTDTNQNRAFSVVLSDPLSTDPANPAVLGVPSTATVTIVNDDQVLSLTTDAFFVSESGTNAVVTVDRLFGSAGTIAVQFRAFDGSATGGADYQPTNGTLVFLDGQTQATFLVPIVNDVAVEGNETVNLLLTNATAPAVVGLAQATLSIVDDDFSTGVMGFLQPNFLANEQGTNAVITVVRAGGSAGSASVQFSTADGTATAGQDYRGTNGTLIFADGQIARTIVIPILDDLLVEGDETVNLTLSNPAGGVLGAGTATLTIQADEALFSFSALAYATNEFATNAIITVARGDGGTGPASVQYFTSNLTAQAGLDYSNAVGTLTFLPGERSKTFLVPIIDDTLGEGDETVFLVLSNAVGEARIVAPSNAVLTLLDNDVSFSFAQPTYAFVEGGNALVTVIRTGLLTNTVSVTAASSDGTAINGSDYTFTSAVLVFTNGETAKVVTVPLIDDPIGEAVEYFTVDLSGPSPGASVGTPGVTRVEIIDNEDTFSLSTTNYTVDEGATNVEIYIVRNGVPSTTGPVTVTLITANGTATAGQDYVGVTNVVTFNLGQTLQRVLVPITEDSLVEGNETFLVRLANPTPNPGPKLVAPTNAVVTILENDIAVAFSAPTYRITESSGAAAIEVHVIGTATNVVTVSYQVTNGTATAGSDYAPATGRLTFLPGQTNQLLTVPVFDDLLIEGDETVWLRLYNPSNAILTAPSNSVLTIVDDDSSTIVPAGAALVSESQAPANQLIDPGETVTVDFGLRNIGNVDTILLQATLLATNGVTAPSPAQQIYGALVGGGATVARQFTFTAVGTNGAVIRPTFALVDLGNGNNLGTTNFTIVLGRSGNTFARPAAIVINDRAPATPYPSTITVSNVAGTVTKVTATLHNLSHEYPGDLDILLVGPGGTNVVLMSDAGNGGFPIANVNLTFDDAATGGLASSGQIQSGTYRPSNLGVLSDPFDSSNAVPAAPRAPYGTTLTVFNGANPNGSWHLYVMDDIAGQVGNIAGGWSLSIVTTDPLAPTPDLSVTLADAPDPVVLGSLLTYTNTVVNHGPGTALDIKLTNTLPAGVTYLGATASSGSISTLSNQVILALGSLPAGAQATLVVTLRPTLEGTLIGSTTARGSQPDLNLDNNTATVRTIVTGQPALLISRKDNRVVLAWPEAASSFILEGAASLAPASWSPVTADRTISDGYIYVTVDPVGPMQFFRLRSP